MTTDPSIEWNMEQNIKFAQDHYNILLKFGRYPTRNKALGRQSTQAEMTYLETADSYGQ